MRLCIELLNQSKVEKEKTPFFSAHYGKILNQLYVFGLKKPKYVNL